MRRALTFALFLMILGCDHYPSNPSKVDTTMRVYIRHSDTEYVSSVPPVEGIAADKVNVLSFELRTEHFTPAALEIYGRVELEGPPSSQEHSLYFRTDSLVIIPGETEYTFNTFPLIMPGATYSIVRAKYPTNEYAHFEGDQGKVKGVTITEIWAYNGAGERFAVSLEEWTLLE